ncbi:MAG: 23S rRNA (adenine(2503)-C(2))-methyltransferase RlmN [Myxococcales bacterium]|nr:23S rRNA (adenine(2503)-C(2))-methyltransferase RlmN [Myxococcales bacterium]MCB9548453.1 23S rRNA (adenine(2503)-C(2))-methyltransferase RlmN [Myxococcales bacterium]
MSIRPTVPEKSLTDLSRAALRERVTALGLPRYRADQIFKWVFQKGIRDFDAMTDLPKALRQTLADDGWTIGRVTLERVAVSVDGTRKLVIRLQDGGAVESVLIPMGEGRFTQCLSSQLGCALDCKFCFTGTLGLSRHLTAGEIVDQVLVARGAVPEGAVVDHLVFMGMGEPLHNFDHVVASLGPLTDPDGPGYSPRRITISTSGLVPQIDALGQVAPVNLAISLNATTDEVRERIMPINKRYPIAELIAALRRYPLPPRRKLTVEYVLLGGVNDTDADAQRLGDLLRGLSVRINLIPWNPFQGPGFARPADDRVRAFHQHLDRRGYTVTVRGTKGIDIDAACGQLGERPDAA